jgi:hypothetical protein
MKSFSKCGTKLREQAFSCSHCGASEPLDALLSAAVMEFLGIVCGVAGLGLLVFADQIDGTYPVMLWVCAAMLLLLGFAMLYKKWAERSDH